MAASSPPINTVDTTIPFRSVKEAIATYGEQFLARKFASSDDMKVVVKEDFVMLPLENGRRDGGDYDGDYDDPEGYDDEDGGEDFIGFVNRLKKLEDELQETKFELNLLKEKENETEVALASLNAELHKNMSKIARMEAIEAGNMTRHASRTSFLNREINRESRLDIEKTARDVRKIMEDQPTLEQVLSFGSCEGYFMNSKKIAKKKPIVPLITDIFAWKKSSEAKDKDNLAFLSPLYSSSTYLH